MIFKLWIYFFCSLCWETDLFLPTFFFWKKDSGKLIHSFLEGNCIAAMNGMLTVSFVTSTKMCQLLALQHTISFLKFLFTANLNEATSVSWNTDMAVTVDFTFSCHKSYGGQGCDSPRRCPNTISRQYFFDTNYLWASEVSKNQSF